MGSFSISQTRNNTNLYLWVNGTKCTGNITDFEFIGSPGCQIGCDCRVRDLDGYYNSSCYCVPYEDPNNPNDDTYLTAKKDGNELILFDLEDHTTETGDINYIEVIVRAKSEELLDTDDEVYIITSPNADCSDYDSSSNLELTTSFKNYSKIYKTNPETSTYWTWNDIDNLTVGMRTKLGKFSKTLEATFRPSSAGDLTELKNYPARPNWHCVDEHNPDYFNSFVYKQHPSVAESKRDLYNIDNSTQSGTINSITVFALCRNSNNCCGDTCTAYGKSIIKTGGTIYESSLVYLNQVEWTLISKTWDINPNTSIAWTWGDIDNLQIGVELYSSNPVPYDTCPCVCTQVYMIVNYTQDLYQSKVNVSQEYIKVNYNEDVACSLTKPEEISMSHSKNIKMLNFWNGQREVYSLSRSNKTLVFRGHEYSSDACDKIDCVRSMGIDGSDITLSGLNMYIFNKTFKIKSFGWRAERENPKYYEWILEMEYAT